MVFLLFVSAFLFFKTYDFPFSGTLVLGLTLATSLDFRESMRKFPPVFLTFPTLLCLLSLWDGSSPEDILDLISISLAGILSYRESLRFDGNYKSVPAEAILALLLACGLIFSYSREEFSAFLSPALALLFLKKGFGKKIRILLLLALLSLSAIHLYGINPSLPTEPSFSKSILICSAMGLLLFYGKEALIEKILFLFSFLAVSASHPGPEFPGYSLGLFFSYLQERDREKESEREESSG
ncbi:hypothetical protein [Leptospira fluminis]|uniref:hypothetical protein n=1 Tax=Leptospira fluminis TaxID=2484979 RepID=UPI001FE8D0EB|nr:hypothetical protein [Leptospira fluminis]